MSKTNKNLESSLIPVVREEETRLLATLEAARSEGRQLVEAARRSAEQRVESARTELPDLIREARQRGLAQTQVRAQAIRDSCQQEVDALERSARANLPTATRRIVTLVLPGAAL